MLNLRIVNLKLGKLIAVINHVVKCKCIEFQQLKQNKSHCVISTKCWCSVRLKNSILGTTISIYDQSTIELNNFLQIVLFYIPHSHYLSSRLFNLASQKN